LVKNRTIPLVIDADGLNSLAPWPPDLKGSAEAPLILTPHPGEMLRLLGTEDKSVLSDRVNIAREFASTHHVIIVLKGERTLVANPDGNVYVNDSGNPGLGTAGSGDTLTGIITGFMAQEFGMFRNDPNATAATVAAVYIGGMAGDLAATNLGMRTMTASDIRKNLPEAIKLLDPDGEQP
jgi:NAD(P)H-hydrate epimerase